MWGTSVAGAWASCASVPIPADRSRVTCPRRIPATSYQVIFPRPLLVADVAELAQRAVLHRVRLDCRAR